jgi:hypothetical protein
MKNGYVVGGIAGAIAGFFDGIISFIVGYFFMMIGIWEPTQPLTLSDVILWLTSGSLPYNIFWGIIFGLVFVMIYDRIPSKGVKKGLIFGLIFYWILSNIRISQIMWSHGDIFWPRIFVPAGFFAAITYGAVLGYLYKKGD